jgi:hypothetical protein
MAISISKINFNQFQKLKFYLNYEPKFKIKVRLFIIVIDFWICYYFNDLPERFNFGFRINLYFFVGYFQNFKQFGENQNIICTVNEQFIRVYTNELLLEQFSSWIGFCCILFHIVCSIFFWLKPMARTIFWRWSTLSFLVIDLFCFHCSNCEAQRN